MREKILGFPRVSEGNDRSEKRPIKSRSLLAEKGVVKRQHLGEVRDVALRLVQIATVLLIGSMRPDGLRRNS